MVHPHFKEYREHTAIKHIILKDYLGAWAGKLGTWNKNIVFIDGFCGPGYYEAEGKEHDGSPIIALDIAKYFADKTNMYCVFIDTEGDHCDELECKIKDRGYKTKYDVICNTFEDTLTDILDSVQKIAPAFCFVDPFGWSGLPFELIERFLNRPRTEACINFMYEPISRFILHDDQHDNMDELFGTEEWREVIEKKLTKMKKEKFLRDLYREQLLECAKYVFPFRLNKPDKDMTYYYLFHCTNHPVGITTMKNVMYKTGTVGTYSYQGKESSQMSLFSSEPDIKELEKHLLSEYSGKRATFDEIVEDTWDSPFRDTDCRKVLNCLKKDKVIKKIPVKTKGGRGFNGADIAVFPKAVKKRKPKMKGFFSGKR